MKPVPAGQDQTRAPALLEPSPAAAAPPPPPEAVPAPSLSAAPQGLAPPLLGELLEEGRISFYSDALAGRPTASGEPYDPALPTCAHRTLPFGTELLIAVPRDGLVAPCRINDRGPFVAGRVLDVSRAVAEQLGMVQAGVIKARLHRRGPAATTDETLGQ